MKKNKSRNLVTASLLLTTLCFSITVFAQTKKDFEKVGAGDLSKAKKVSESFLGAIKSNNSSKANNLMADIDFGIPVSGPKGEAIKQQINALDKILGDFSSYEYKTYQELAPQGYSYLYLTYEAKFTNDLVNVYITIANYKGEIKVLAYQFMPKSIERSKKFHKELFGQ